MTATEVQRSTRYQALLDLPTPRPARIKPALLGILVVLPTVGIMLIGFGMQQMLEISEPSLRTYPLVVVLFGLLMSAIMLGVSGARFWRVLRDKKLMEEGVAVIGVVTHQKLVQVGGR